MRKIKKYTLAKPKQKEILKTISSYLMKSGEIYAAYIYGSFITERPFADIDLGICMRREPENVLEYETQLENNLEKRVKFAIDVRVLNNAPLSLFSMSTWETLRDISIRSPSF